MHVAIAIYKIGGSCGAQDHLSQNYWRVPTKRSQIPTYMEFNIRRTFTRSNWSRYTLLRVCWWNSHNTQRKNLRIPSVMYNSKRTQFYEVWYRLAGLNINPAKTFLVTFSRKRKSNLKITKMKQHNIDWILGNI